MRERERNNLLHLDLLLPHGHLTLLLKQVICPVLISGWEKCRAQQIQACASVGSFSPALVSFTSLS